MTTGQDSNLSAAGKTCPACGLGVTASVTVCPRDGTRLSETLNLDPAFNNYEFLHTVGEGGMGVIYKARHQVLNKFVAIKTLHTHLATPEAIRRFQLEGKAASLLSHPNIVSFYDLGVTQSGQPYIIMEYVEGKTLAEVLRRQGQLPFARFLKIFRQIIEGLSQAHKKQILHRDIKPSNIMIVQNEAGEDEVRILDFGIAKMMNDTSAGAQHLTKTGDAIGSPVYMSPEQARGSQTDQRSDLYSIGCVMYEVLTGIPPFQGNTALDTMLMHLDRKPPAMKEASMGREIDARMEKIVLRLLEKDPADRYQSMDELKEALLPFADPERTHELAGGAKTAGKVGTARATNRLPVLAGVSVVAIFLIIGFYFWLKKQDKINKPQVGSAATIYGAREKADSADSHPGTTVTTDSSTVNAISSHPENKVLPDIGHFSEERLSDVIGKNPREIRITQIFFVPEDWDAVRDENLAPLEGATSAMVIDLQYLHITDKALEYLKRLPVLKDVTLSDTKVKTLRPLKNDLLLKALYLARTTLLPEAFANIATMKNLKVLTLDHTNTTDRDLAQLAALKSLTSLSLIGCTNFSLMSLNKLQNQLPNTVILYCPIIEEGKTGDNLLAEAQTEFGLKHWSEADSKAMQAMCLLSDKRPSPTTHLVAARVLHAKCLYICKLPLAALTWYEIASTTFEPGSIDIEKPRIKVAKARIYEEMADKTSLQLAASARVEAAMLYGHIFSLPKSDHDLVLLEWKNDLDVLIDDLTRFKAYAQAEDVAWKLRALPNTAEERHERDAVLADLFAKQNKVVPPALLAK